MSRLSELDFVPSELAHIGPIAARMRQCDRVEVAAFGRTPEQSLREGIARGEAWTALVDGIPEAMFGWVIPYALEREGTPWMLGTEEIYRQGRALLLLGVHWLDLMFDSIDRAENLVSADNPRAIRLLQRWGFVVERDETMIGGVPFRMFWQERG